MRDCRRTARPCHPPRMPIHTRLRLPALAALCLCAAACSPPPLPFARLAGLITDGDLDEVSGMAASRAHEDVLWAIEDSGNPARLYALSRRGRVLARYKVEGAKNDDWEDLASFDRGGKHYLLVADTGDNGGKRRDFVLHVEDVLQLPVVPFRPERVVGGGVDELRVDPQALAQPTHASCEDMRGSKRPSDLSRRHRPVLEGQHAGPRPRPERADSGKLGDDVLRDPVAEVLILLRPARVVEVQHGD